MSALLAFLLSPGVLTAILGLITKVLADRIKPFFAYIDSQSNKSYKLPVQIIVTVCSVLVTLGNAYLQCTLSTTGVAVLVSVLGSVLPTYISAMGIHKIFNYFFKGKDS